MNPPVLPAVMQAIVFSGSSRAELRDRPLAQPPLRVDEIAGRTLVTLTTPGIELNAFIAPRAAPIMSGYAAVMEVDTVGAAVTDAAVDPVESRRALAQQTGVRGVRAAVPADNARFALAAECSGHEQAVLDTCRAVRPRGEVVLIGALPERGRCCARRSALHPDPADSAPPQAGRGEFTVKPTCYPARFGWTPNVIPSPHSMGRGSG